MSHVEEVREAVRAVNGPPGSQSLDDSSLRPLLHQLARYWWVELLLGVFWVVVAIVASKFNHASVVTVGVLTGIMFLVFAGIWALVKGTTDIVRAFQLRQLGSS